MQVHSIHLGNYIVPQTIQGGVCVDIGGNTGQFALKYKDFFREIHIYEPQKECYNIIKQNLEGIKNITVFDEAVYHTSNLTVNLVSHLNFDSGSVAIMDENLITVKEWTENIVDNNCKTVALVDILARIGGYVDYMKIDCENSEYHLLIDNDLSRIKYMGIELHWQMGKDNFDRLVNHILKFFNNVLNVDLSYPSGNIEVFFESKFL